MSRRNLSPPPQWAGTHALPSPSWPARTRWVPAPTRQVPLWWYPLAILILAGLAYVVMTLIGASQAPDPQLRHGLSLPPHALIPWM